MRILTHFARPGLVLALPVTTKDGMPLLGRGTRLTQRHLRALYDDGVRTIDVDPEESLGSWDEIPEVPAFLRALETRFAPVAADRRMAEMKDAIRDVYLDYLAEIER